MQRKATVFAVALLYLFIAKLTIIHNTSKKRQDYLHKSFIFTIFAVENN